MEQADLKMIEQKAYLSFHNDGWEDLLAGAIVFIFAVAILTPWFFLVGVVAIAAQQLTNWARCRLTYPRIGYIRPSGAQQAEARYYITFATVALALVVLGTICYFVLIRLGNLAVRDVPEVLMRFVVVLVPIAGLILVGAARKAWRWTVYSLLAIACSLAGAAWRLDPLPGLAISAVAIMLWGLVLILQFLRSHPVLDALGDGQGSGQ